jgi:hypothetical protein
MKIPAPKTGTLQMALKIAIFFKTVWKFLIMFYSQIKAVTQIMFRSNKGPPVGVQSHDFLFQN